MSEKLDSVFRVPGCGVKRLRIWEFGIYGLRVTCYGLRGERISDPSRFGFSTSMTPFRIMLHKIIFSDYEDEDEDDLSKSEIHNPKSQIELNPEPRTQNPEPRTLNREIIWSYMN